MLREVVDRECVGGIWCASARVDGINFQACLIDHSSLLNRTAAARQDTWRHDAELCQTYYVVRSRTVESSSCVTARDAQRSAHPHGVGCARNHRRPIATKR